MEPYALVASGCRHRGPARGAVDRGQPDTHLPGRKQPQRHIAGPLSVGKLSPRPHSKFHARADADRLLLRASVRDCSVVTAGDLV
jgi:hypothetical protein